jgi:hypothetical protein
MSKENSTIKELLPNAALSNEQISSLLLVFGQDFAIRPHFIQWSPTITHTATTISPTSPTPTGVKIIKKPVQQTNQPAQHKSLLDLAKSLDKCPYLGLVFNQHHPLICLDLDGVYPEPIRAFTNKYPTFIEHSASGKSNRLHVFYYTSPHPAVKQTILPRKKVYKYPDGNIELFSHSKNYIALTGIPYNQQTHQAQHAQHTVATLTDTQIQELLLVLASDQLQLDQQKLSTPTTTASTIPIIATTTTTTSATAEKAPVPTFNQMTTSSGLRRSANIAKRMSKKTDWVYQTLIHPHTWINQVPASEEKATQLLEKFQLTYYEYWLKGLMCLHALQKSSLGLSEEILLGYAHKWSQLSGQYDEAEVDTKWESFSVPRQGQQAHTLITSDEPHVGVGWYYMMFIHSIPWASTVSNKYGGYPACTAANTDTLLSTLRIFRFVDQITKQAYVISMDSAVNAYLHHFDHSTFCFAKHYNPQNTQNTQDTHFLPTSPTNAQLYAFFKHHKPVPQEEALLRINYFISSLKLKEMPPSVFQNYLDANEKQMNLFQGYIDSLKPYDPDEEPDYLNMLASQIIRYNPDLTTSPHLHKTFITKWMLSLGRSMWAHPAYRGRAAEGMLIFYSKTGGRGKTALTDYILPSGFSELASSLAPDFSGQNKDFLIQCNQRLVVNLDEVDQFLKNYTTAKVKNFITAREDTFRVPYGRKSRTYERAFSVMASTNNNQLCIDEHGMRRFWWIYVDEHRGIDLATLSSMDRADFFRQIKYELENNPAYQPEAVKKSQTLPWNLSRTEQGIVEQTNKRTIMRSNTDEMLAELFNTLNGYEYLEWLDASIYPNIKLASSLDFDGPLHLAVTWSATEIRALIKNKFDHAIKLKELKYSLRRLGTTCPETFGAAKNRPKFKLPNPTDLNTYKYKGQDRYYLPQLLEEPYASMSPLDYIQALIKFKNSIN